MAVGVKTVGTQLKEAQKKILELEKNIVDLEKKVKHEEDVKNAYYKEKEKLSTEINSVHTVLDCLFVPRYVVNEYGSKTEMTMSSRLFAWQSGSRLKETKVSLE